MADFDADEAFVADDFDAVRPAGAAAGAAASSSAAASDGFDAASQSPMPDAAVTAQPFSLASLTAIEWIAIAAVLIAVLMFVRGRAKNRALVASWYKACHTLLVSQFSVLNVPAYGAIKWITYDVARFACVGRPNCGGMGFTFHLSKRQDLLSSVLEIIAPNPDTLVIEVPVKSDAAAFVLSVFQPKEEALLRTKHSELKVTRRTKHKTLTERLALNVDTPEAVKVLSAKVPGLKDESVASVFNAHAQHIRLVLITDLYSEGTCDRMLRVDLRMAGATVPMMHAIFALIDAIADFKLTREAMAVRDKARETVTKAASKATHEARQEAAKEAKARRLAEERKREEEIMARLSPEERIRREQKQLERKRKEDAKANKARMKTVVRM